MAESPEPLFEEGCHLAWKMRENLTSATSGFFVFFLLFGDKDQCPCRALFFCAYHRG